MMELYVTNIVVIFIYMTLLFVVAQFLKNNAIVDIGWGIGFVIIAVTSLLSTQNYYVHAILVAILVTLWGARLGIYLLIRAWGKPEDFRYANFRKQWGKRVKVIAFFRVFMLQGAIMLVISYPIIRTIYSDTSGSISGLAVIGAAIWAIGYFFQVVGDAQLAAFRKRRRSKEEVLTTGLWKYTRHPNYFGEASMWWGLAIIALTVANGYWGILSALAMNFLLVKVSGVPFLDRRYANNMQYQQYKRVTNRFIPWLPKRSV